MTLAPEPATLAPPGARRALGPTRTRPDRTR
jgi:hypothetical protein